MNEIIKIRNDKYAEKLFSKVQHDIDALDLDKYVGKRKKFTYHVYEDIVFAHDSYESKTVYQYWEYLSVTATDLKNYIDVINPQYVVDIEFITEFINLFEKAATDLHEHLCEINCKRTEYYI